MLPIVWINGAFGAGKTSVAQEVLRLRPDWMLFDPEEVGFMARTICAPYLAEPEKTGDFQDLDIWVPLVVQTAAALLQAYHRPLVVPMTLVDLDKWIRLRDGLAGIGALHHFTLAVSAETLAGRLVARGDALQTWPHLQIGRCVEGLARPELAVHLDAEANEPTAMAAEILDAIVWPIK